MKAALSLDNFSLRYSASAEWALSKITFDIPLGSCCAVLGAVSSGKTTLLQTISGLLAKHHRTVQAEGKFALAGQSETTIPNDVLFPSVGLVQQDSYVMVSGIHETVEAEIAFTLQNLRLGRDEIRTRLQAVLSMLNLQELAQRHPLHLSGGEVQRVALASILVAQPRVLLLDEPRNSLDSKGQTTLARILRSLHGDTTVIFSDYDIDLMLAVADYVVVLDKGKCLYQGEKKGFLARVEEFMPILISDSWNETLPLLLKSSTSRASNIQRITKVFGVSHAEG